MTIIVDNITTPYCIHRYNEIARVIATPLEVWYLQKTEKNREWKKYPPSRFRSITLNVGMGWSALIPELLKRKRRKIDRVIVCGWNSLTYLFILFWCWRNGVRCTLWSGSTAGEAGWLRTLSRPIVKLAVGWADDYLTYGTRAKEYLLSLGADPKKVGIFWNNVDLDHFRPRRSIAKQARQLRDNLGINHRATVILYVGQLIRRKGVDLLLESFSQLDQAVDPTYLMLAGVGPLLKQINSENQPNLHVLGHVEYDQLPSVYAASDLVVLPSREEVWGLVVNEALAAGKPVFVSKSAGASELVGARWRIDPTVKDLTRKLRWFSKLSVDQRLAAVRDGQAKLLQISHRNSAVRWFTPRKNRKRFGE